MTPITYLRRLTILDCLLRPRSVLAAIRLALAYAESTESLLRDRDLTIARLRAEQHASRGAFAGRWS